MTSCTSTVFIDSSYSTGYLLITSCKLMGSGTRNRMFWATSSTICTGKGILGVRASPHNPQRISHAQCFFPQGSRQDGGWEISPDRPLGPFPLLRPTSSLLWPPTEDDFGCSCTIALSRV